MDPSVGTYHPVTLGLNASDAVVVVLSANVLLIKFF